MMIMVFVTFRAAVFMRVEVTTLLPTQLLLGIQVYILAALAIHSNNNWSHNGNVNPRTSLDEAEALTFTIDRKRAYKMN